MTQKNICIIGAGIGGLSAGALLTKEDNVTVFEKELLIGGRAITFNASGISLEKYKNLLSRFNMKIAFSEPDLNEIFKKNLLDGYKLDLGYHLIGGGVSSINSVLSELDDHADFLGSRVGLIKENGYDFPFISKGDKLKILPNILRLIFANEKTMQQLDSVSIAETINKYGAGKMKLMLEIFSRSITTINNLDLISTGEMLRAEKNLLRGAKPVGYPKGGLSSINQKVADYISKNGGKILLQKPVKKIIIKENKATGVLVGDKEYPFDIIISNILVQDLFKIADEKHFPKEYVEYVKSLRGTGSLCAYYSLKKIDPDLIGKSFHFIERNVGIDGNDVVGMIDFMSATQEAGLAPSSDYLVQSYIICTPNEAKDKKILGILKKLLDKNLESLIPDFRSNLNWAIYPTIWHLDGVAKTIDNVKPDIKTPVENLFIIGDCVKAPGIGINCAVNSALVLKRILLNKH